MDLPLRHDLDQLAARMSASAKQLPFGTALALSLLAGGLREDLVGGMPRRLDRRVPWTVCGARHEQAIKGRPYAVVDLDRKVAEALDLPIRGGTRKPRPGKVAVLLPAGVLLCGRYRTFPRSGSTKRPAVATRANVFAGKPRGDWAVPPGLWRRLSPCRRPKSGKIVYRKIRLLVEYAHAVLRSRPRSFSGQSCPDWLTLLPPGAVRQSFPLVES